MLVCRFRHTGVRILTTANERASPQAKRSPSKKARESREGLVYCISPPPCEIQTDTSTPHKCSHFLNLILDLTDIILVANVIANNGAMVVISSTLSICRFTLSEMFLDVELRACLYRASLHACTRVHERPRLYCVIREKNREKTQAKKT